MIYRCISNLNIKICGKSNPVRYLLIRHEMEAMAKTPQNIKTSFPPISTAETEILILGTLPGDNSLHHGEYFAHPRNRFWKVIAAITGQAVPETYAGKLELLYENKIGLWNVLYSAERKGSLDSAIRKQVPNDLPAFIARHRNLKVIGFDGLKPATFYDKYFTRSRELTYLSLPSCSPANARFNLEDLSKEWAALLATAV